MTEDLTLPAAPEWGDLYLRFPDKETADDVLHDYTGSIDVIGEIYKPTGNVLATDYGDVPEMALQPGWHVNVRGPMLPELQAYAIEPRQPVRVWA